MVDQASSLRKLMDQKTTETGFALAGNSKNTIVLSVTSGKGGVGKTNIVASLAEAFRSMGQRVLIIDADLGLSNVDIIFGVHPEYHIGHVIDGEKNISEVLLTTATGIKILPAGSGVTELTHLTQGQKMNLLVELGTLEGSFDIVLVDTGAGISPNVLYFNAAADDCMIIATREPTSITDAYAMMKVMNTQHGIRRFKLLINMVRESSEAKAVYLNLSNAAQKFLSNVVIEYMGFIPQDETLQRSVIKRVPVIVDNPGAASSQSIKKLARMIMMSPRTSESGGNIKFFVKRFVNMGN
ncbi:MinD/ParA family protein [Desulforegula conservatrix]|uniref:MinD/ParA family protein n=1 Tax=Desulforegula conservatrix TaxID=153026 RepID=UPI000429D850|nr:MinD/ParA family protein [Desulforegula conservatrix]